MAQEAALVDPGGPDLGCDPKEIYRNLGIEICSLPHTAKCDKVRDFLRRNPNVDIKDLAEQINFVSSRTLYTWVSEIRKSAQVQPLVPAVADQGIAPNVTVVDNIAANPSLMLGHARQPQTGLISSLAVRAHPPPTVHRWRDFRQNKSMKDGIHRNVMSAAGRQAAASLAPPSRPYAGPYNQVP